MQFRLLPKEPEEMSLDEARYAYDEAVKSLGFEEIRALEQYSQENHRDSEHRAYCKRLYRRIVQLED